MESVQPSSNNMQLGASTENSPSPLSKPTTTTTANNTQQQQAAGTSLTLSSTGSSHSSSSATASPMPQLVLTPSINNQPLARSSGTTINTTNMMQPQMQMPSSALSASASSSVLSIKVRFVDSNITKTLQFNQQTLVYDALKIIREKIPETSSTNG